MKSTWTSSILVVLATFVAIIAGCKKTEPTQPAALNKPPSITIGYSRLRISIPIFVAQEQGLFQKHGVNVNLLMYDTAQPMMQALVDGKIEAAGYTALPITDSAIVRSHQSLYFVSAMLEDQQHRVSYLLKKSGSNIHSIADLKGKRIGILPTIAYKAWLQEILKANNIPLDSVVIQQIAPELEVSSLKSGGIDALFSNDPIATAAITAGVGELITNSVEVPQYLGSPFLFGSFNIRKDWADSHKTECAAIVAAIDDAIDFADAHPDAAKDAIRKYIPAQFGSQVSLYPNALYLNSTQTTALMFQHEVDAEQKLGILPLSFDISGLVYHEPR